MNLLCRTMNVRCKNVRVSPRRSRMMMEKVRLASLLVLNQRPAEIFFFPSCLLIDAKQLLSVTLRYNRARLWEELNMDEKAKETYKALSDEHPSYLDCEPLSLLWVLVFIVSINPLFFFCCCCCVLVARLPEAWMHLHENGKLFRQQ